MGIIVDAFNDKFPIIFRKLSRDEYIDILTQIEIELMDMGHIGENYLVLDKSAENGPISVAAFRLYHRGLQKEPWGPGWRILRERLGFLEALRSGYWLQFFAQEDIPKGTLYIDSIGVKESFRDRGIGRFILNTIEEMARQQPEKFDKLSLFVKSTNSRALHLYKSFGFKVVRTRKSFLLKRTFNISEFYYMVKNL